MGRHKRHRNKISGDYLRSAFFGIEDSLVSTTGLIAGIGAGMQDPKFIVLAGIVGVSVEAVSMAAGEFLSEQATNELKSGKSKDYPILGGIIMLLSYLVAGLLPIIPIVLLPPSISVFASVALALIGLFILGLGKGKITGRSPLRSGLEVLVVGGVACAIGIAVGVYMKSSSV